MSDELRRLREQVAALASEPEAVSLDDETWYDRLWELLEPVIDSRAELALRGLTTELPSWAKPENRLGLND
jgi:hypothetical protein